MASSLPWSTQTGQHPMPTQRERLDHLVKVVVCLSAGDDCGDDKLRSRVAISIGKHVASQLHLGEPRIVWHVYRIMCIETRIVSLVTRLLHRVACYSHRVARHLRQIAFTCDLSLVIGIMSLVTRIKTLACYSYSHCTRIVSCVALVACIVSLVTCVVSLIGVVFVL